MARRGQRRHLKRLPAPKHWPIKRKHGKFTTQPRPGPHAKENCLTLALVLREVLGYAENMREAKAILSDGQVKVDGRVRKDFRFPVGMMDVIEIENSGDKFRVLPKRKGGYRLVAIDESESGYKLCRIEEKMMVKGGKIQIGLHDGRSVLLSNDATSSDYKTLDTLKIGVPGQDIMGTFPLERGAYAVVASGKNVGIEGRITEIERRIGTHASTVTIQDKEGNRFQTALDYVFVVGKESPDVTMDSVGGETE